MHTARCSDRGCRCREYRPDKTPEFLLRAGVRGGEWQHVSTDQLRALMRPEENDPVTRIYAYLLLQSVGQTKNARGGRNQPRLAVKIQTDGKTALPVQPIDVMRDLNAMDSVGRLDRQAVRRAIRELERMGRVRQVGSIRKRIHLFVYLKPLKFRSLTPIEEPNLVVQSDYQIPASPRNENDLRVRVISQLRPALVKAFRTAWRQEFGPEEDLVAKSDYQKLIDDAVERILLGVWSDYQKLVLVVRNGGYINKEATTSTTEESAAAAPQTVANSPHPPAPPVNPKPSEKPKPQTQTQGGRGGAAAPAVAFEPQTNPELMPILTVMGQFGPVDIEAAETILLNCRKRAPDVTPEEVAQFYRHKMDEQFRTREGCHKPIGFALKTVPGLINPPNLKRLREENARRAQKRS